MISGGQGLALPVTTYPEQPAPFRLIRVDSTHGGANIIRLMMCHSLSHGPGPAAAGPARPGRDGAPGRVPCDSALQQNAEVGAIDFSALVCWPPLG